MVLYDVILVGFPSGPKVGESASHAIAQVFGIPLEDAHRLVEKMPTVVKSGATEEVARKYFNAFSYIGATSEFSVSASPTENEPPHASPDAVEPEPPQRRTTALHSVSNTDEHPAVESRSVSASASNRVDPSVDDSPDSTPEPASYSAPPARQPLGTVVGQPGRWDDEPPEAPASFAAHYASGALPTVVLEDDDPLVSAVRESAAKAVARRQGDAAPAVSTEGSPLTPRSEGQPSARSSGSDNARTIESDGSKSWSDAVLAVAALSGSGPSPTVAARPASTSGTRALTPVRPPVGTGSESGSYAPSPAQPPAATVEISGERGTQALAALAPPPPDRDAERVPPSGTQALSAVASPPPDRTVELSLPSGTQALTAVGTQALAAVASPPADRTVELSGVLELPSLAAASKRPGGETMEISVPSGTGALEAVPSTSGPDDAGRSLAQATISIARPPNFGTESDAIPVVPTPEPPREPPASTDSTDSTRATEPASDDDGLEQRTVLLSLGEDGLPSSLGAAIATATAARRSTSSSPSVPPTADLSSTMSGSGLPTADASEFAADIDSSDDSGLAAALDAFVPNRATATRSRTGSHSSTGERPIVAETAMPDEGTRLGDEVSPRIAEIRAAWQAGRDVTLDPPVAPESQVTDERFDDWDPWLDSEPPDADFPLDVSGQSRVDRELELAPVGDGTRMEAPDAEELLKELEARERREELLRSLGIEHGSADASESGSSALFGAPIGVPRKRSTSATRSDTAEDAVPGPASGTTIKTRPKHDEEEMPAASLALVRARPGQSDGHPTARRPRFDDVDE